MKANGLHETCSAHQVIRNADFLLLLREVGLH